MASDSVQWWSRWSDIFTVTGLILGAFLAVIAILGWFFSSRAGNLKDEELGRFQVESKVAISKADGMAAEANHAAAQAHERAAQLEKEAIQAKVELAELQAKIAPRTITSEQSARFSALLEQERKAGIGVWFNSNDNEAYEFAKQLHAMLQSAGYKASEPNALMVMGKGAMDCGLKINADSNVKSVLGDPFLNALQQIGVEATLKTVDPKPNEYHFSIEVGSKPIE